MVKVHTRSGLAVLIPIKSFDTAKGRLHESLSAPDRYRLARATAETVIAAGRGLDVFVICDDDVVAGWAARRGAGVLRESTRGLNPSVTAGVSTLEHRGYTSVIVAHGDLPLADDLRRIAGAAHASATADAPVAAGSGVDRSPSDSSGSTAELEPFAGVTIVPDRHDDGSNVLVVPTGVGFVFSYGPGSFYRHRTEAARIGIACRVIRDPRLSIDLDTPDDLLHPLIQEALPWLPTNPANQR